MAGKWPAVRIAVVCEHRIEFDRWALDLGIELQKLISGQRAAVGNVEFRRVYEEGRDYEGIVFDGLVRLSCMRGQFEAMLDRCLRRSR